ncbi:filamentous hemagglutinin [Bartonella sp. 220]|uniref:filamentous hemagglutinin n=1 Tax=Bartonella sp. 220B TaxID=2967260 RepID=UPI0022A90CE2|nr:filamentous hemagglutinin [Bartonella sp. 220B]MCZ2159274.1 filamentous hemagglutinin [Bartonella sp. 220B]
MFYNGLFNTPDEAARNAVQLSDNEHEPLYFVVFPESDSAISELMVAGYQKFMENNFWGLTNSTQEAKDLIYGYGNKGLELYGHSRASMTLYNTLNSLKQQGVQDRAENTEINLYGPAANAEATRGLLTYLRGGKKTTIGFDGHRYDFVSRVIGGNGYTYETIPPGSNRWKEWWNMFSDPINPHTCLGDASDKCTVRYGSSHRVQVPLRNKK